MHKISRGISEMQKWDEMSPLYAIFLRGRQEFGEQVWNVPISLARRSLAGGITSLLNNGRSPKYYQSELDEDSG
jgi:hypothetical protein